MRHLAELLMLCSSATAFDDRVKRVDLGLGVSHAYKAC
jgi:hypothetical protein